MKLNITKSGDAGQFFPTLFITPIPWFGYCSLGYNTALLAILFLAFMKTIDTNLFAGKRFYRVVLLVAAFNVFLNSISTQAQWQYVAGNGLKPSAVKTIDFYDARNGLAYGTGDTAYFTQDGGENWIKKRVFLISGLADKTLKMVGPSTYYGTGYQSIGAADDYQHCFLRRINGTTLASRQLIEGGTGPGVCLDSTHWINTAYLYHTGNYSQYEVYNPTSNGQGMFTSGICYTDWMEADTCRISSMAVTPNGLIYLFKDSKLYRTTKFSLQSQIELPGSLPFLRFEATGDSVLYGNAGGLLKRSTDEGLNWSTILSIGIGDYSFVYPDTGFAGTGAIGMKRTYDGGLTWQNETLPALNLGIKQFSRSGRHALYALCSNGRILRNTAYTKFPYTPPVIQFETSFVLDSTFATNGKATRQLSYNHAVVCNRLLHLPDGKFLYGGFQTVPEPINANFNVMWKVDGCGKTDSSFGLNGLVYHTFEQRNTGEDFLIQPDGKIVVVGSQAPNNFSSTQKPYIGRYQANGQPDSTFGTNGTTKIEDASAFSLNTVFARPGGKFLATSGRLFMKFNADGSRDATFGNNGKLELPAHPGTESSSEGSGHQLNDSIIWSVVAHRLPGFDFKVGVYSLKTNGLMDSTFGVNGSFMESLASLNFAVAIHSILLTSGKLVVATTQNDQGVRLVRIMRPGKVDSTFGTNGFVFIPGNRLEKIHLLSGDRILVCYTQNGVSGSSVKLLDINGVIQSQFSIGGASNIALNSDVGALLTGLYEDSSGELALAGGNRQLALVRIVPQINSSIPTISQTGNLLNAQVNNPLVSFQWYRNGVEITSASAETLEISQIGTYRVEVTTEKGCTATDEFVVSTFVGVNELILDRSFTLFPNPANETVTIESKEDILKITLIDALGRELIIPASGPKRLDIRQLKIGMYWVKIQTDNGLLVKKLMKQ